MQRSNPHDPPRRLARAILPLGVALLAAALLAFLLMRPNGRGDSRASRGAGREAHSGYVNRAIVRTTMPSRAPAVRPSIKGIVYDADGHPVRDAVVAATTFELAGNIPTTAASTKADELGRFELPLPAAGTYQVSASMEGFGPASATARAGEEISLVLAPSGAIVGRVVDEQGNPVTRFSIDVVVSAPMDMAAPPPIFSRAYSVLDGSFRVDQLPIWTVVVRAAADGYAAGYTEDVLVPPGKTQRVDIILRRGCTISGRVIDSSGSPVPDVTVDAEAQFGSGLIGSSAALAATKADTDEQGRFQIEHVPTGSLVVRAYDGQNAVTSATIQVSDCEALEPIGLVLGKGGTVRGVARQSDGSPLPHATLTFQNRSVGIVSTTSDGEGKFHFDRLPTGLGRLALVSDGQAIEKMVLAEQDKVTSADISLVAEGTGEVRGRVTAGGTPLAGVRLVLMASHGRKRGLGTRWAITDADGAYRVTGLPVAAYIISVDSSAADATARVRANQVVTQDIDVKTQLALRAAPEGDTQPTSVEAP